MQQYYNGKGKEEVPSSEEVIESESSDKAVIDTHTREQIIHNLESAQQTNKNESSSSSLVEQIDPSKIVKEVQTITSEVTQHVDGNHLQVKTLTLTTTLERPLHPTESEFNTDAIKPTIDISINDLEATSIPETPALVISRTYSVTERTMRTTVVPVFDGTITQSKTVTESFFIRKLITAYRTLPPGDVFLMDNTDTSTFSTGLNTEVINMTDISDLSMAEQSIQPSSIESKLLLFLDQCNLSFGYRHNSAD